MKLLIQIERHRIKSFLYRYEIKFGSSHSEDNYLSLGRKAGLNLICWEKPADFFEKRLSRFSCLSFSTLNQVLYFLIGFAYPEVQIGSSYNSPEGYIECSYYGSEVNHYKLQETVSSTFTLGEDTNISLLVYSKENNRGYCEIFFKLTHHLDSSLFFDTSLDRLLSSCKLEPQYSYFSLIEEKE